MPQRVTGLLYGLLGLAAAAGMFFVGFNVYRAAGKGPEWRRRLLGSGLAMLAALGLISCSDGGEPAGGNGGGGTTAPAGTGLEASKEWRALAATWKQAEQVASGKRGAYPFTRAGKKRLLEALATAVKTVENLAASGELSEAEAGLLRKDLATLTDGVQRKRSKEMRNATCYKPMMVLPARDSAKRLADRLPLLEKLASGEKLKTAVVKRVLVSVQRDLATLKNTKALDRLEKYSSADERKKAEATREAVRKQVEQLKKLLAAPAGSATSKLEDSKAWKQILAAWKCATPLATSGKSATAQRKQADAELKAAGQAADKLAAAGLLAAAEAGLLKAEMAKLRADIYRDPPTDCKVTCYEMMMVIPAQKSFARLKRRLPLLEKLVAAEKLSGPAWKKVVATIESDVKTLSNQKELGKLQKKERAQAVKTRDAVKVALEKIRALNIGK